MTTPDRTASSTLRLVLPAGLTILGVLVLRSAWLSDDAFITLRSVDNFVNGDGPRWNVAERVQAFTHPAWFLLISLVYAITREPYYTVIALQTVLTIVTVAVIGRRLARTPADVALVVAALAGSKAFVDFSTSGLENPLTHLTLVLLIVRWIRDRDAPASLFVCGLLTAIALMTRLDLALLIAPIVISLLWPVRRARLLSFGAGLLPLVVWELFSVVYYGLAVPNTALAKLPPGVSTAELMTQGWRYLLATWHFDPVTPALIAAGLVLLALRGGRVGRLLAAGIGLHVVSIVTIGGDFMAGRFLTPALIAAVSGTVALVFWPRWPALLPALSAAIIAASLLGPAPPLTTGANFGVAPPPDAQFAIHGVTDERRFYYPALGLLRVLSGQVSPDAHANAVFAAAVRGRGEAANVVIASSVGVFGFYAGRNVHIIDRNALADPFLARLPPAPGWRPGHFVRDVPAGYFESCKADRNLIEDPRLREIYEDVRRLTRDPIWSAERLHLVLRQLAGGRPVD